MMGEVIKINNYACKSGLSSTDASSRPLSAVPCKTTRNNKGSVVIKGLLSTNNSPTYLQKNYRVVWLNSPIEQEGRFLKSRLQMIFLAILHISLIHDFKDSHAFCIPHFILHTSFTPPEKCQDCNYLKPVINSNKYKICIIKRKCSNQPSRFQKFFFLICEPRLIKLVPDFIHSLHVMEYKDCSIWALQKSKKSKAKHCLTYS